ncbi:hypothetical protein PILCRDRAFT_132 [Piloderma croceum F 1598]|uniref:Uncharacterized protein n=1 Tax=Piloderma croceum (strain F 1598) TaxID=765440 RepID=A0A0C3BZL3_PILCF|nr:hypothetical protein PILCRDRAFT_132 [Piloderma croceum F 1598]
MSSKSKPLPLSETLRDLALLRASDLDLSSLLPATSSASVQTATTADDSQRATIDHSVIRSYEFAVEARKTIRIFNLGDIDSQGSKVENARSQLEDVLRGLEPNQ